MTNPRTWSDRYPEREPVTDRLCPFPICGDDGTVAMCIANGHCGCNESAAAREAKRQSLGEEFPSEQPVPAAAPFEWHDFRDYGTHELKRGESDHFAQTQPGDLDIFSRPLRPGT